MYYSGYYDIPSSYYYSSSSSSAAAAGFGAAIGAMMGVYSIIAIAITVLQIVAMWKIFSKAGWKSLIPIYNLVILFKISGLSPWTILAYLTAWIPVIGWVVSIVITVLQANGLSKSFGKSTGFTIGLVLLPSIFYLILGFGNAEYVGKDDTIEIEKTEE